MKWYLIISLFLPKFLAGQTELYCIDRTTNEPVSEVHVFIDQTNFNVLSDRKGRIVLPEHLPFQEKITVSHLNYEIFERTIKYFTSNDTLWLQPMQHKLQEVEVVGKSNNKRKKWLKKFQRDLLGVDQKRLNVAIKNPEVLIFSEQAGTLSAEANGPLIILNEGLGYEMNYWLESYRAAPDGTITYHGKYFISGLSELPTDQEVRDEVYQHGMPHFFKSLIEGDARKYYQLNIHRSTPSGELEFLRPFNPKSDLSYDQQTGIYEIRISDILEIVHLKKVANGLITQNKGGLTGLGRPAEQDMIQQEKKGAAKINQYERSYLFSRSGKIKFSPEGRLLNSEHIKEYGFWGTLGLANALPLGNYATTPTPSSDPGLSDPELLEIFYQLLSKDASIKQASFDFIKQNWQEEYPAALIELMRLSSDVMVIDQIGILLDQKTGQSFGADYFSWVQWLWKSEEKIPAFYADLKGKLYQHIDPKFLNYFQGRQSTSIIRLDEVLWGGVMQDGIPPLRMPELISAEEATYLGASDIVFGVFLNGEAKAYPKRILAWHEFFVDKFGHQHIAGVYCTLCGTVIAYDMTHEGIFHDLGTSGFLYRSNKLMYDQATQSLWNTIEGRPVVGPLIKEDITLKSYPVVTTTWLDWHSKHPYTKVLSLDTGHDRNYAEGEAYRDYFATDRLMFPVPSLDNRLKNKDEVLIVRAPGYRNDPLAISVKYLIKKRMFQERIGDSKFVILTDKSGATRVFQSHDVDFKAYQNETLIDKKGRTWKVAETEISLPDGTAFERIPSHHIFWFAWYNAYPETRLVR